MFQPSQFPPNKHDSKHNVTRSVVLERLLDPATFDWVQGLHSAVCCLRTLRLTHPLDPHNLLHILHDTREELRVHLRSIAFPSPTLPISGFHYLLSSPFAPPAALVAVAPAVVPVALFEPLEPLEPLAPLAPLGPLGPLEPLEPLDPLDFEPEAAEGNKSFRMAASSPMPSFPPFRLDSPAEFDEPTCIDGVTVETVESRTLAPALGGTPEAMETVETPFAEFEETVEIVEPREPAGTNSGWVPAGSAEERATPC